MCFVALIRDEIRGIHFCHNTLEDDFRNEVFKNIQWIINDDDQGKLKKPKF